MHCVRGAGRLARHPHERGLEVHFLILALLLLASVAEAQYNVPPPSTCTEGSQAPFWNGTSWSCNTITAGSLPSGLIAFWNGACPSGWTEVTAARGRIIVGTPASGTDAATVGTALTDAQDKSTTPTFTGAAFSDVINHTHPVTDPGHAHTQASTTTSTGAGSNRLGTVDTSSTAVNTGTATTGITTANPAGGVASITPAGTVSAIALSALIATIQFRVCSKD